MRWESSYSDAFNVSNGVRQGSVLSPVLFAVYLDGLLKMIAVSVVIGVVNLLVHFVMLIILCC